MTVAVVLTPTARGHVQRIDAWWRADRLSSPDLFSQELAAALAVLEQAPRIGRPYADAGIPDVRRVVLRSSRFHVYYSFDEGVVAILAVWSGLRGSGPPLGGEPD